MAGHLGHDMGDQAAEGLAPQMLPMGARPAGPPDSGAAKSSEPVIPTGIRPRGSPKRLRSLQWVRPGWAKSKGNKWVTNLRCGLQRER